MVAQIVSAGVGLLSSLFGRRSSGTSTSASKELQANQNKLDKDFAKFQSDLSLGYESKSSKITEALNKNLMDYQYALERQSRRTSFNDTRMDLESAGYNPLLAVGSQSNYTPVSSGVSGSSADVENSGVGMSRASALSNYADAMATGVGSYNQTRQVTSDLLSSLYKNDEASAHAEYMRDLSAGQVIQNLVDSQYKMQQASENLKLTKTQRYKLNQDMLESQANIQNMMQAISESKSREANNALNYMSNSAVAQWNSKHPKWAQTMHVIGSLLGSGGLSNAAGLGLQYQHNKNVGKLLLMKGKH